ncbi:Uncharacterized protein BTT61001_05073 [Bacillus thuringiensis]|uniref:Delta-aminolevulinic acid dehydratase n=1 Tax=Bacillus thuringiensis TaxID=1428 RepID=A0A1C4G1Q9_BACTU|nr:Uncharacterized protein BTT61001_05073 [Bacillus thuringiensis]
MNVALVVGFNSDLEAQSIRASLEYFGAKVVTYWIGRPREFINILSGKGLYNDIKYVIFCFHGEEGKFVMEELGEDIYEQDEPRGYFGAAEIYPALTDSKTPTSKFSWSKEVRWEINCP